MKRAVVFGAGGFIGSHTVNRLKNLGCFVRGVDLKYPEYSKTQADEFIIGDLRDYKICDLVLDNSFDTVFQYAADMGGAGYIFTGEHDADVMHNSASINLNVLNVIKEKDIKCKIFYSSSACIYPAQNQIDPNNPNCEEDSAFPASPDSEYGWEKLFSERLYASYNRNYSVDIRIARFHNIFGPEGSWNNGKEKSPAALCRKVAQAKDGDSIDVWGTGEQTRSFLYIDECLDGVFKLMDSDYKKPINIGSSEMISINNLAKMVIKISGKDLKIKNVYSEAIGVMGRNSDNRRIFAELGWEPTKPLIEGITKTYEWINKQVNG